MIKVIPNISAVADQESQGKRLYNKIYVLLDDDVDYSQLPEITIDEQTRSMAALSLKEDAKWAELNFAKFTGQRTSEGSAGDITTAVTNTLTGTLGGHRAEIDNLLENFVGRNVHVVEIDRFTQKKYILTRPYSPMVFSAFSGRKNGENTSTDVTFSNESFFQPLEYLGSVTE
ncbi:MAG: hypothetical protein IKW27_06700 [Bacteroidales bacterium]|nr:hypothetical protein [Bacteroidales bacterium]